MNPSDREFLGAFIRAAQQFTTLAPPNLRDPRVFGLVERRAAEILEHPPLDLQHRVMDHIDQLRQECDGAFGGNNSDLLEELGSHPQARRVFYAVIAACHELEPELEPGREMRHPPRAEPLEDRDL